MAAKMAVYYKKYEKIFPETGKNPGICIQNAYLIDSWITLSLKHPSDAIHASFRILYIQDGIPNGSQQVLQTRGRSTLPVGMSDWFVTDQKPCLIEQHFTNMGIWMNDS